MRRWENLPTMAKQSKKKTPPGKPKEPPPVPLAEMDIQVNELGQIVKNFDIDRINTFLNEHVPDKKFTEE
jgi:hypothetical protein